MNEVSMNAANGSGNTVGLLSFAAFAFSVIAAVVAIDMFALLRTGEFGRSWRVLIIASVIFALTQALRLGEALNFRNMGERPLSQIGDLMFVMALAYALYLQRQVFTRTTRLRRRRDDSEPDIAAIALRRASDAAPETELNSPAPEPLSDISAPSPDDADDADDAANSDDIEWSRETSAEIVAPPVSRANR